MLCELHIYKSVSVIHIHNRPRSGTAVFPTKEGLDVGLLTSDS